MNQEKEPGISIIVATHNRTAGLARCLQSLLAMDYPTFEIIVVDNAPSSNETADFIQQCYSNQADHAVPVHYVREDRPGLAVAHNGGLKRVSYPLVAFTDDDVMVDTQWLRALAAAFAISDNVGCVTGKILPAELETDAQRWIEQSAGFNKGGERRLFDLGENHPGHPLFPYAVGMCGSGANMAFRTSVLQAMGGFDPALGAGSRGVGGDDLAAFFEVIIRGYTLVYEPAAFLYHWHYRDYAILRRQAYGYGVGLTAYLTKTVIDHPRLWPSLLKRIPQGLYHGLSSRSEKNHRKANDYPHELTLLERKGMVWGPIAYLQSRWL